jgi:hypothetical protein
VAEDRDRPGIYISIVEFPSYEKAIEQSNNPDLSQFASRLAQLMSGRRGSETSTFGLC